ncbi:hypothetical protein GCM10011365_07730 [Marinicella pacifica]|uniref:Uncharacterized protein n=1 Tax=Marinicella pacifica TaxID=1171543 RepID=A0A917CK48_9GAMM|nr:hypothetical protein GCM10011365_07730 [Marinicella pacifica]
MPNNSKKVFVLIDLIAILLSGVINRIDIPRYHDTTIRKKKESVVSLNGLLTDTKAGKNFTQ